MKIAVNGKSLATSNPGGAVRVGLNIVYHLAALVDWQFELLLPGEPSATALPWMPDNVLVRFQSGEQQGAFGKLWWEQWQLPRLLNAGNYDLVLNLTNSCAVLRRINAPQMLLVHDSSFLSTRWFTRSFSVYLGLLIRMANWRKCQVVTVSQTSATQLKQAFSSLAGIKVIPNGLDKPPQDIVPHLPGYPYLLFLGSKNPRKNLEGMLRAFQCYRREHPDDDHHLVIVGGDKDIFRDVDCPQDDPFVEWFGYVDDEQKWSVLAGASGLLLPSFLEGFGLPVGEALLLNIPVAASDIPVFHEIYGDAIDVYVDPHDIDDMANGIGTLLKLDEDSRAGNRSRARVLSRYDWPAVAAQYHDLCLQITEGKNA